MAERPEPSYVGDQPFVFVSYGHADSYRSQLEVIAAERTKSAADRR